MKNNLILFIIIIATLAGCSITEPLDNSPYSYDPYFDPYNDPFYNNSRYDRSNTYYYNGRYYTRSTYTVPRQYDRNVRRQYDRNDRRQYDRNDRREIPDRRINPTNDTRPSNTPAPWKSKNRTP